MKASGCVLATTVTALLAGAAAAQSPPPASPTAPPATQAGRYDAPAISDLDGAYLVRLVRRTMLGVLQGRSPTAPSFVPRALARQRCRAFVTLRRHGRVQATGSSLPRPVVEACEVAAMQTLRDGRLNTPTKVTAEALRPMQIELELVGDEEPMPRAVELFLKRPAAMSDLFVPGRDGILVRYRRHVGLMLPSQSVTHRPGRSESSRAAMNHVLGQVVFDRAQLERDAELVKVFRIRSAHFWEPAPGAPAVRLVRGVSFIGPQQVTAEAMDAAITRIAGYMKYRQNRNGLFSYEYQPSIDRYSTANNDVRQMGALWALSRYARLYDDNAAAIACLDGIETIAGDLTVLPGVADAQFLARPRGRNKLGAHALLMLALIDHPDRAKLLKQAEAMGRALAFLQQPDGKLRTEFPPAPPLSSQLYAPGEGLLAMVRLDEISRLPEAREVPLKAFDWYRDYWAKIRDAEPKAASFVPWHSQAWALATRRTGRREFAGFVFDMTDWLLDKQLTPDNCPYPEMWGGFAATGSYRAGSGTAAWLEGLCDALELARRLKRDRHAARYEAAVRAAVRFVMQLEFRSIEGFYVRSPQDTYGGIRQTFWRPELRIDNSQHALLGLIEARRLLFGPATTQQAE